MLSFHAGIRFLKSICFLHAALQFAVVYDSSAQILIRGDTLYQGLQLGQSKLNDVIALMGKPSSKTELRRELFAHLSGGGHLHKSILYGYAIHYKKRDITLYIDKETNSIIKIMFGLQSKVITAKGIEPNKYSFADVLQKYGALNPNRNDYDGPRFRQWTIDKYSKKAKYYTVISYGSISFVSKGKYIQSEDVLTRKVDEIWID